ncbi:MAG TPA: GGDEF domain-containing protein [Solirubrobacteraceae bacterium]|nr:GGDEF domain-containing protein [Solirubrobacteraceae bacterium]
MALLHGTSAVGLAAIAAAPLSGSAPTSLYAACGCLLAVIAGGLVSFGTRIGPRTLLALAGVRVAVVAVTLSGATSGGATLFGGAGLIWVALWVTAFYPMRTAIWTIVAEVAAVIVASLINPDHLRTALDALPMITGAAVLSVLLAQVLGSLRHEARHDELTGLMNRRGLDQAMHELASGRRFCASAHSLVVIDLDGLKLVNDHAGHLAGDQMLVTFATELQTAARGVDLTARIGGDEFIAILPGLSGPDAIKWADELQELSGVAWSYGVAERGSGEELETWLNRADKLMYAAKTATRAARANARAAAPALA